MKRIMNLGITVAASFLLQVHCTVAACTDEESASNSMCESKLLGAEIIPTCDTTGTRDECLQLRSSKVSFQSYSHRKMLSISLDSNMTSNVTLQLRVVSGTCRVNCSGGINDCNTSVSEDIQWHNVSSVLYIDQLETSKYYCVTASIAGCCYVCTETLKLEEQRRPQPHPAEVKAVPMMAIYFSCFLIFMAASIAALFLTKQFCDVYLHSRTSGSYANLSNATSKQVNLTPAAEKSLLLAPNSIEKISVLLLYSRETCYMQHVMDTFRLLLHNCGLEVWDPLDTQHRNSVRTYGGAWIESKLQDKNSRVILVETTIAALRQRMRTESRLKFEFDEPHDLDYIFIYGLSYIQNHVDLLLNNYNRIFVVRLDGDFHSFVPLTRYDLPTHWRSLVAHIYGWSNEDIYTIPATPEVSGLELALESSISILRASPPVKYQLTPII